MVLLIIIPMKNGYFIGNINPTFSDKPIYASRTHYTSGSTPPTSKMFMTHIAPETLVKCMETLHFGAHMVPFIVIRG